MMASSSTFRPRLLALADEYEHLHMENAALKLKLGMTTSLDQRGEAIALPVYEVALDKPFFPSTPSFDTEVPTESLGHPAPDADLEVLRESLGHQPGIDPVSTISLVPSQAVQEAAELPKCNSPATIQNSPNTSLRTTTYPISAVGSEEDLSLRRCRAKDEVASSTSSGGKIEKSSSIGTIGSISSRKKSVRISMHEESISPEMMHSLILSKSMVIPRNNSKRDDTAERASNTSQTVPSSETEADFSYHDSFLPGFEKASPQLQSDFEIATLKALHECYTAKKDPFVMSPLSSRRLLWDCILFSCVLFELWVTPFELLFFRTDALPKTFKELSNAMTIVFIVDVLANFNTGYISRGEIVMKRGMIAREYMHGWFWLDLLSSIPFDWLFSKFGGSLVRGVKIGKAFRIIRAARYLRVVRTYRRRRHVANSRRRGLLFRVMVRPITPVFCIILLGHLHACMWAALSKQTLSVKFVDALQNYYQCFWQAWICLLVGVPVGPKEGNFDFVFLFDILVSVERIFLLAIGGVWAVVYAHTKFSDYIDVKAEKGSAIKYLKSHAISMETQLQFRFSLEEMAEARMRQKHFNNLVSHHQVTEELHRRICCELWARHLMSFGLITQIAAIKPGTDFIIELCLCVREEVFASKAVLFQYGDAAIAAYCVLTGRLSIVKAIDSHSSTPDYEPGHWLGETALVNPQLRRAMSVITQEMSELMAVPADSFQKLLASLGLTDYFQQFIRGHLWKGLCARCGVLGDHFADRCPGIKAHRYTKARMVNASKSVGGMLPSVRMRSWTSVKANLAEGRSGTFASADELPVMVMPTGIDGIASDLWKYLKEMNLFHLKEDLKKLGIVTLDDLLRADNATLRSSIPRDLDLQEQKGLSREQVQLFISQATRAVQRQIFDEISADHYIFLSHSKIESGTEAALIRTELETLIHADTDSTLNDFRVPIFLDSENLRSLTDLQDAVNKTHNLVLLLSPKVLQRVWVLVEIATAHKNGVRIVLVHISKPGANFEFPDVEFYRQFRSGEFIQPEDQSVMDAADLTLEEVYVALRSVFKEIAVPYSPHMSSHMRRAQLECLLKRCRLK